MTEPYYQDDLITLYHGDCREVTEWLAADVLVSDVPYGMGLRSGRGGGGGFGDLAIANDESPAVRDAALVAWGGQRPALIFGRWSVVRPAGARALLVWDKGEHVGMGDLNIPWKPNTEEIYVLGCWPDREVGRSGSVLRHKAPPPGAAQGRNHPTEKPVDLMADLIGKCPSGVVADPFAGSGSTLVAAKRLGRKAIGVELDEDYCRIAASRLGSWRHSVDHDGSLFDQVPS